MRKSHFLIIVFAGLMMSCVSDDIDAITDINIPLKIDESLTVDTEKTGTTYSVTETLKLEGQSQITSQNLKNVEKVTINKISYSISDYNGADNITVTLQVLILDATENTLLDAKENNININAINGNGEQTLSFSDAESEAVTAYLLTGNEIIVVINGDVSDSPAEFDMNVKLVGNAVLDII